MSTACKQARPNKSGFVEVAAIGQKRTASPVNKSVFNAEVKASTRLLPERTHADSTTSNQLLGNMVLCRDVLKKKRAYSTIESFIG